MIYLLNSSAHPPKTCFFICQLVKLRLPSVFKSFGLLTSMKKHRTLEQTEPLLNKLQIIMNSFEKQSNKNHTYCIWLFRRKFSSNLTCQHQNVSRYCTIQELIWKRIQYYCMSNLKNPWTNLLIFYILDGYDHIVSLTILLPMIALK